MSLSVTINQFTTTLCNYFCGYSHNTHSCSDVTDDEGQTPLDLASEEATAIWNSEDVRKRCTEITEYLKSLPTEYSELVLYHS